MIGFMREEREHMKDERTEMEARLEANRKEAEAKIEAQRKEAEAQRQEAAAAKLEAQRKEAEGQQKEIEKLRSELAAARPRLAAEVIGEEELAALQSRLQSLHTAKLLTDEELYCLEDAIVDCIEVMPTAGASSPEVGKVARMMLVSAKVPGDAALARQLRRKFV